MYMKMGQEIPGKEIFYFNSVIRLEDLSNIPFDEENVDYQQYIDWVNEGNEPIEFDISVLNP